jgi:hypothetical protein
LPSAGPITLLTAFPADFLLQQQRTVVYQGIPVGKPRESERFKRKFSWTALGRHICSNFAAKWKRGQTGPSPVNLNGKET